MAGFPVRALWKPESIETVTMANINTQYSLQSNGGQLPKDRFMSGILLNVKFRVTNPSANNPTNVMADAPYSMLSEVIVEGKHRLRKTQETIVRLHGPDIAEYQRLFTRVAPIVRGDTIVVTADAAIDVNMILFIPFTSVYAVAQQSINYLVDAPNYETLEVKWRWGDTTSLFRGQTAVSEFTAYESTTGSPTCEVIGLFAVEPVQKFAGFVPGFISRYYVDNKSGVLTSSASNARIFDIPKGGQLRSLMIKTGVMGSALTGGNVSYQSLSDDILANLKVRLGTNRSIWDASSFYTARAIANLRGAVLQPSTGYALIDWLDTGNFTELWDLRNAVNGATGDIDTFFTADVTGAANQFAKLVCEEVLVRPSTYKAA